MTRFYWGVISALSFISVSCTVQNNLYVNNPTPLPRGEVEGYLGLSTGLQPKIDSTDANGFVYFSDDLKWAPNLNIGANIGVTDRFNLGIDLHFPYAVGGFGMNVRPQISFMSPESNVQLALAGRLGFVVSKEFIEIGNAIYIDVRGNQKARGSLNMSVAMPLGFRVGEEALFIITPRLSRTSFAIWDNVDFQDRINREGYTLPILSLGARYQQLHFEASIIKKQREFIPSMGLVYLIRS